MSDHEKGLLEECFRDTWVGTIVGEYKTKIDGVCCFVDGAEVIEPEFHRLMFAP